LTVVSLRRSCFAFLVLLFLFNSAVSDQVRSATITGTATDPSGAVLSSAEVILTEQQTAAKYNTKTTEAGTYVVPYLPAGVYTVAVDFKGFAPYSQKGVNLTTSQTVRVDVTLLVGTVAAVVEVAAQAAQIQTDSSTVQGSVQAEVIAALPNPTQNPLFYAFMQAGVMPTSSQHPAALPDPGSAPGVQP
jgi:hypothetical protein